MPNAKLTVAFARSPLRTNRYHVVGIIVVDAMRQQMKPSWRVHGIITHGGEKPNIIPAECTAEWYLLRRAILSSTARICIGILYFLNNDQ